MTEKNNLEALETGKVLDEKENLRKATGTVSACAIDKKQYFYSLNEAAVILFFILVFLLLFY
ncbi:hypothetical protein [Acetivibrio straminisolvens]|uniref:Uncharacterized protein n=1 Tax=Acetivibrio straminisolvens JCM 21531 TaxID=1294263 RepID=W4V7S9_9FIRM|nr:hypothetical protein [Acetivibrio straminisolvens]GAE88868.1 hypothetical protein JCM21531_2350 [Acetivibrio straminisolvens JCM 21531]